MTRVEAELRERLPARGGGHTLERKRTCRRRAESSPYLLMDVEFSEDLGGIQQVGVVHNPARLLATRIVPSPELRGQGDPLAARSDVLLDVPDQQGRFSTQGQPVAVDEEQEGQESVDGGFGG